MKKLPFSLVKKLSILLALFFMLTVLAGCGQKTNTNDAPEIMDTAETTSTDEPRDWLRLALLKEFTTFNPYENSVSINDEVIANVYDTLFYVDNDGSEEMRLAESYSVSDDELVWTIHIRQGVFFQNGEELKASDVIFSFEAAMESAYISGLDCIESISVIDDYTVEIKMGYVYAPIKLALNDVYICNEKYYTEQRDQFDMNPIGTSAYQLVSYQAGVGAELEAFDDYWGTAPQIKRISFRTILDQSTALMAFESGELDFAVVPTANWDEISSNPEYKAMEDVRRQVVMIYMNVEKEPFDNPLLRKALAYAINKEDIIAVATDGHAEVATTLANPKKIIAAANPSFTYDYNLEKAKQLLAEAGYPNGLDLGKIITTSSGVYKAVAQVFQQNLKDIGITIEIESVDTSVAISEGLKGNYTMGIMGIAPASDFAFWERCIGKDYIGVVNYARYDNPEVEELFDRGTETLDVNARKAIYQELVDIVQEDCPYIPVYWTSYTYAMAKDFNYVYHVDSIFYRDCYFD